jgi:FAD/FMN-containing dehydrogenase
MNIHGKNNYRVGTLGEHVQEFTALLPTGDQITATATQNPELFYAMIGSAGLLGIFTSITLQLKRVHSGDVRVRARAVTDLDAMLTGVDRAARGHEYAVGWLDATAGGRRAGRGQLHVADHLAAGDDPHPADTLRLAHQALPDRVGGIVPRTFLPRLMPPLVTPVGLALVNTLKYHSARLPHESEYRQSLVGFNFLLDFVPGWERAYGRHGLIQYQSFLPLEAAGAVYTELLERARAHRVPAYLAVVKRHRPDRFLMTHAVDGFSLALDFKVTRRHRARLEALVEAMNRCVVRGGGRFYFAKDSTLTADVTASYLGVGALRRFAALKRRCDPDHILQSDLYRRILRPLRDATAAADPPAVPPPASATM